MGQDYIYKKAEHSEIDKVNSFNNIGRSKWETEFFSTEKQPSFLYECVYDNEVIGTEGYVSYDMNLQGETALTHRSERTLVSGNHRGKGIFDSLVKKCDEEGTANASKMCWGSTTALKAFANVGFEKYVGFRTHLYYPIRRSIPSRVGQLFVNYKLLYPLKLYRSYKQRDWNYLKRVLALYSAVKGVGKTTSELQLTPFNVAEANKRMKDATASQKVYSIKLDDIFIGWLGKKGRTYNYHQFSKDGKNVGHVIYYINAESKIIHIVDFFVEDGIQVDDALNALSAKHRKEGMLSIFIALNNDNTYHSKWITSLKSKGVFAKDGLGSFVIKNLQPEDKTRIPIAELLLTDLWLEL